MNNFILLLFFLKIKNSWDYYTFAIVEIAYMGFIIVIIIEIIVTVINLFA